MDFSERYIKKCRLATQLQDEQNKYVMPGTHIVTKDGVAMILNKDDAMMLLRSKRNDTPTPFFLFSQDFLQAMSGLKDLNKSALERLTSYFTAYAEHAKDFQISQSMNEFWLDYAMLNIYMSRWSYVENNWVKLEAVKLSDVVNENNTIQK